MKAYFFGCWNQPGHYLFHPGGSSVLRSEEEGPIVTLPNGAHIDGGLAPRKHRFLEKDGSEKILFVGQSPTYEGRRRTERDSSECQQGCFLIHHFGSFTYMSWWDRAQGDTRGACNSTFILEGEHKADVMLAMLEKNFPHVVENLRKAKISLREVTLP
jgi:hypothetical protein